MTHRLRLLCICVLAFVACEQPAASPEVAGSAAALSHVDRFPRPWHKRRHHRHAEAPHTSCTEVTPTQPVCRWQTYEEGLIGTPAAGVYFDPRVRGVAYATSGSQVWQSTDGGETWSPRGQTRGNVVTLTADGEDPNALIASTGSGLKISEDAGLTWRTLALGGLGTEAFEIAQAQPQRMYATSQDGPMLTSTDGGYQWNAASPNYPRGRTYDLDVDPRNPLVVLAGLWSYAPGTIAHDNGGAIFRTDNGGITWSEVGGFNAMVERIQRCAANPDIVLAATRLGVARSVDGGNTWTLLSMPASTHSRVSTIALSSSDCDDFYVLHYGYGPRHTRDAGATFSEPLVQGLSVAKTGDYPGVHLALDPEDPTHLIIATHAGFYASHDSGQQWAPLPVMLSLGTNTIAVSPHKPSQVWLATWGQGLWTRESASSPWRRIGLDRLPKDYFSHLALDPNADRVIGGVNQASFSADGGETWVETTAQSASLSAAFDPSDPNVIYLSTQVMGVYKSQDAGQTWHQVNQGLTPWPTSAGMGIDVRGLALNPRAPNRLFAATNGHGIYRSDDGAQSWTQVLDSPESARCIVMIPSEPETLYACLGGVTVSEDGGRTWVSRNAGLSSLTVFDLLSDPQTNTVYAATSAGLFKLPAGATEWQELDPDCEIGARSLTIMEQDAKRYLVAGGASIKRVEL